MHDPRKLAMVDPHASRVGEYLSAAELIGAPIAAVLETHVQADHVTGMPELVARTGALIAGIGADATSTRAAIGIVAALTAASGLVVSATSWQPRAALRAAVAP